MTGSFGTPLPPLPRRGPVLLWAVTLAACAGTLLTAARRAHSAHAAAQQQTTRYTDLARSAQELSRLRDAASGAEVDAGAADQPKLATLVGATLAAAGLPPGTLTSLSPESESLERIGSPAAPDGRGRGSALVRRRATLVLTPLTLPQLGRFLSAWRQRAPGWTPARIDVEPRRENNARPGADLPLSVSLAVESVAVQTRARTTP